MTPEDIRVLNRKIGAKSITNQFGLLKQIRTKLKMAQFDADRLSLSIESDDNVVERQEMLKALQSDLEFLNIFCDEMSARLIAEGAPKSDRSAYEMLAKRESTLTGIDEAGEHVDGEFN